MHGALVTPRLNCDHLSWRPSSHHRLGSISITYAKRYKKAVSCTKRLISKGLLAA
jgi:hypothetical protein